MASRTECMFIVAPTLSEQEALHRFADLLIREQEFPVQVEHRLPGGGVELLQLTIAMIANQTVQFGTVYASQRPGDLDEPTAVCSVKFEGWVYYERPNPKIPATIQFHWQNVSSGTPVYGHVDLSEQHRAKLGLPNEGPLPT